MSVFKKVPHISSTQIVEKGINIDKLGCATNDLTFSANSNEVVPTQRAVRTYVHLMSGGLQITGNEETPTEFYVADLLADKDIVLQDGDEFTYIYENNLGQPVDAIPMVYSGFDFKTIKETLPAFRTASEVLSTQAQWGRVGTGFNISSFADRDQYIFFSVTGSLSGLVFAEETSGLQAGVTYQVKYTVTGVQENHNGLRVKVYERGTTGINEERKFLDVETTALTNGNYVHNFVSMNTAIYLVFEGKGQSRCQVENLTITNEDIYTGHHIEARLPVDATYTYRFIAQTGLSDEGASFTATNFDTPLTGEQTFQLKVNRPFGKRGLSMARVLVTGTYDQTNPDGTQTTSTKTKEYYLEVRRD